MDLTHVLTLLLIGGAAALVSALLTPIGARWAMRWGLVDLPDPRKQHEAPVALLGGASVLISLLVCGAVSLWLTGGGSAAENMTDPAIRYLVGCWIGASLLAAVGLRDDIRPVPILLKLAAQLTSAGVLMAFVGPLAGMPGVAVAAVISVAWLVLITNSFNLIDNMDGLAPGVGAVAAGFFALLARDGTVGLGCAALAGALVGFLVFNRHPARVFLGDGGSLPIGFLLGAYGLWIAGGEVGFTLVVLLILGILLLDTSLVVISRLRRGLNPLTNPGRDHISHRLVALGLPIPVAVAVLWALGLGLGLVALVVVPPPMIATWIVVASLSVLWIAVIITMERAAPFGLSRTGEVDPARAGDSA